ncbi:MAG: MMPL family transporter [Spirochaetales bacterium]|nr:MMPL family transporter [Spirochaetales bacterium]
MERRRALDWIIISLSIVLTALGLLGIGWLHVDSSTDAFIPTHADVVQINDRIKERFGSLDPVVVSIYAEDTILQPKYMEILKTISEEIEELDGVSTANSIANVQHLEPSFDGVEAVSLYDGDFEAMKNRIEEWPSFYEGTFLSADHTVASVLIQTTLDYDSKRLLHDLREVVAPYQGVVETSILGLPAVTEAISESLLSDLGILVPIVATLIILILYYFLRSFKATLLSLVPLIFSSSVALGIMAVAKITFTMATMLVPVLLLIVGSAYTIHIFSHFFQNRDTGTIEEVLRVVVKRNTYPIIAAAATTAFGFLAQLSSPLEPFRIFGLLSFIGVVVCAFSSLVLLPALIRVVYKQPNGKKQMKQQGKDSRLMASALNVATRHGKALLWVSMIILVIFLPLSYYFVESGTNMLDFFRPSSSLVKDSNRFNERMQGSFSMTVMIEPGEDVSILDPSTLKTIEAAIMELEAQPVVGGVQSIIPFVKRMNQLLGPGEDEIIPTVDEEVVFDFFAFDDDFYLGFEDEPAQAQEVVASAGGQGEYEIPSDPARYGLADESELANLIAQYLLLYSGNLDMFINDPLEPDVTALTLVLKSSDTNRLRTITTLIPTLFPEDWNIEVGGGEAVALALADLVTRSQIVSLFSSLVAVWFLVWFTLKSPKLATLALIPCLFALLAVFVSMHVFAIKLDIVTSLLAALCIGIGVDYAIHLLSAIVRDDMPMDRIMQTTGKAILANAASVSLGFIGLLFSRFMPIANLGVLFCIAMATAAASALLLLPAVAVHYPKLIFTRRTPS